MTVSIFPPFPIFVDLDGSPLEGGSVYVGTANTDPTTSPISVYFDAALTVPASQPLRTSGGFVVDGSGTPQNVYAAGDFSITIKNRLGVTLYTAPSYGFRIFADAITFNTLTVNTSIVPDAAGGAFNGSNATAWSSTVTQGLRAKTGTVYDAAQPSVSDDLAAFNQRKQVVLCGRQTSTGASATNVNIYNSGSITFNSTGDYTINPTVAIPSSISVLLTPTVDVADLDLIVFSRTTTAVRVKTYLAGVLTNTPFDFVVFGNPAVADPIS